MSDQVLVYGEYVKYKGKKLYLHTYVNNLNKS